MKKDLLIILAVASLLIASCSTPRSYGDIRGTHYGKGNHYHGKYHGARHRYNWEKH